MRDVDDADDDSVVEDLIDNPKLASTRREPTFQLIPKWLTDPIGIIRQRTSDELPASDGDCLG